MLIGQALSGAGIDFVSLSARHHGGKSFIQSALVYSEADATRLRDWAAKHGIACEQIHVATTEQIADHERWAE